MASPQLENGHTRIANELLQALCSLDVSGPEYMIALTVISRTYGWNKKEAQISLTEFCNLTKMHRPRVIKAIKLLVRQSVLVRSVVPVNAHNPATYCINKDYDTWQKFTGTLHRTSSTGTVRRTDTGTICYINKQPKQLKTVGANAPIPPVEYSALKTVFKPPSLAEVVAYCRAKQYGLDPHEFYSYWNSVNWTRKGNIKIKCWKATVDNSERRRMNRLGSALPASAASAVDSTVAPWDNPEARL